MRRNAPLLSLASMARSYRDILYDAALCVAAVARDRSKDVLYVDSSS
ncbi:MAG: hypothetical protein QNJ19_09275 [Woeseiaceae bacterium]|nr:hypothetical protein [Woeseiaceae bacterium]